MSAQSVTDSITDHIGWSGGSTAVSETEAFSSNGRTPEKIHVSILDGEVVMCRYVDPEGFEHAKMVLIKDDPEQKISEFILGLGSKNKPDLYS